MAKISARGAYAVAKIIGVRKNFGGEAYGIMFVMCSDGRVLQRTHGGVGRSDGTQRSSSYSIMGTVSRENATKDYLLKIVAKRGYTIVEVK